jgi:hypothetical protein
VAEKGAAAQATAQTIEAADLVWVEQHFDADRADFGIAGKHVFLLWGVFQDFGIVQ